MKKKTPSCCATPYEMSHREESPRKTKKDLEVASQKEAAENVIIL